MPEKILLVDDDPLILQGYIRQLHKKYTLETCQSGKEGLATITHNGPFAVIVSDMRMPEMDGVQFLSEVRTLAPDSVRMMLTGVSDQQTAVDAVNEGNIFRFLTKPCAPETLIKALDAGLEQYWLITAEKEILEKTLNGSIKVLIDILSLINPVAFGRAARVRRLTRQICECVGIQKTWHIEIAAMLSQIGCVTVPEEIVSKAFKGDDLDTSEMKLFTEHPRVGKELIANVPRLEPVSEIIEYQEKHYDGTGFPENKVSGEDIPQGARILKLALDYDTLFSSGLKPKEAFEAIRKRKGWYDPSLLKIDATLFQTETESSVRSVRLHELKLNMVLAEDVKTTSGMMVIGKGQEVTSSVRIRLENFAANVGIQEPLKVLIPGTIS